MKAHTIIYMKAFGYSEGEFIPCEISGYFSNDIHHIEARGMGGDPTRQKDRIENLMAVTRKYHDLYGDSPEFMAYLYRQHEQSMIDAGVKFSEKYIHDKIDYYSQIEKFTSEMLKNLN